MIIKDSALKPYQQKELRESEEVDNGEHGMILTDGEQREIATQVYGPKFDKFSELVQIKHLIPVFKDFYLNLLIQYPEIRITDVASQFNAKLAPGCTFHPRINLLDEWATQWKATASFMAHVPDLAPSEVYLDAGMRSLASELVADAHATMREASNPGENLSSRDRIALKRYVSDVLAKVTTLVHGKAKIMLQASGEKRENASFLLETLQKASAGKLKLEDIEKLRNTPAL